MPVSHIDPSVNVELQVAGFKRSFSSAVSPSRARGERAYLKSDDRFHGVTVPFIRHTAARFRRENLHLARPRLLGLVARLWQSPYHDLRSLGIALLEAYQELLRAGDFSVVEDMLRKSRTWDHVDWLSVKVAGSLVRRFKSSRRTLVRWSKDDNFWIRRASMLALLDVLRWDSRDLPLFERFASCMIDERSSSYGKPLDGCCGRCPRGIRSRSTGFSPHTSPGYPGSLSARARSTSRQNGVTSCWRHTGRGNGRRAVGDLSRRSSRRRIGRSR